MTSTRPLYSMTLIVTTLAVLASSGSSAQTPKEPAPPPSWRVECTTAEKALDCRALQEIKREDNHQLVGAVVVRVPTETKKPVMMIQLPLGILVNMPVGIQVEGNPPEKFAIQTCTQNGCFVGTTISDRLLGAMRAGKELQVSFQATDKQNLTIAVPLSGFAVAYDKLK
jgi:invasion protein IalB